MKIHTLELTIQRRFGDHWPVLAQRFTSGEAAPTRREGVLALDPEELRASDPNESGAVLGKAVFRDEVLKTFVESLALAGSDPLHVLLSVEDPGLRREHWERLAAPLDGKWVSLTVYQRTPFAIHLPSASDRRFPPISRLDLRALVVVANPICPEGWRLPPFDVSAMVRGVREALGPIPSDVLADGIDGAIGRPTLDALASALTSAPYTLLHVVAHGRLFEVDGRPDPIIYLDNASGEVDAVTAGRLISSLSLLGPARGLPHFTFLGTCESAAPEAERALGGLGQRLVRELGMPAVLAMTDKVTVASASALASEFYKRLRVHGEVDRALAEACAGIAGRPDIAVPVPALFSRLTGYPLFSQAPDGHLTPGEVLSGLDRLDGLLNERAPSLRPEFEKHSRVIRGLAGAERQQLSRERQADWDNALAGVDKLVMDVLELSFEALAYDQTPPPYDPRCPFKGLESFKATDRAFFFAREAWVENLRVRLDAHPFLAVLGPSGSGKSSLVMAGLVPALQDREPGLPAAVFAPGSDPVARLDEALAGAGFRPPVVVVDQFEEVFTLCIDPVRREAFFRRLLDLATTRRVVVTMRADFWGDCASHDAIRERMRDHQELIPPMTPDELRDAMVAQAWAVGLDFEIGLAGTILSDVEGEPGAMPLLQHALLELWNRRHGRRLRASEYQAIGRVQGAIARTANDAYAKLFTTAEQDQVRDIFLRLVQVDESADLSRDTRKRVRLEGLVPTQGSLATTRSFVERLADRRLLVTTARGDERLTEVEVAHEALIRRWDRLRIWIAESRAVLRLRQGVENSAAEWVKSGREPSYLVHKGPRLTEAERIRDDPRFGLAGLDREYVDACVAFREGERLDEEKRKAELEHARKQRLQFLQTGLAVATVLTIVSAVLGIQFYAQRNKANDYAHRVEVESAKIQIGTDLDRFAGTEAQLVELERKIEALRVLEPSAAAREKDALREHFVEAVRKKVLKEKLEADDFPAIRETLKRLDAYAPDAVAEFEGQLKQRQRETVSVFALADGFGNLGDVFDLRRVVVTPGGVAASGPLPEGDRFLPTKVPCLGDVEIEGRFALPPGTVTGLRVGLVLNGEKERGYAFTLNGLPGGRLLMRIERNKVVLRETELGPGERSGRLFAKRTGASLNFTVGNTALNFVDTFPLSGQTPGVFGVVLEGSGPRLVGLAAKKQLVPPPLSALDRGDGLFSEARYRESKEEFVRLENTTSDPAIKAEAGYKKALCLLELRDPEAKHLLEELSLSEGPWQRLAKCQLWRFLLRTETMGQSDLLRQSLMTTVNVAELALVLTEEEREELLSYYRQVGMYTRINWTTARVQNLKDALEIEKFLKDDRLTRQRTLWRLVDALLLDGRVKEAVSTIESVLAEHDLIRDDRIGVTRDYTWMMIVAGTPEKALSEINRRLDPANSDAAVYEPMLLDRARAHAAIKDWEAAEADVDRFINTVPKPNIAYSDFAEACLFRGFLLERAKRPAEAKDAWRAGLRKNWPKNLPVLPPPERNLDGKAMRDSEKSSMYFVVLASLTGELGEDEAGSMMSELTGVGDFASFPVVKFFDNFLRQNNLFTPEHIRSIVLDIYRSPADREFARRVAFLEVPFGEWFDVPLLLAVEAEVRLDAIPEAKEPELAALVHEGLLEIPRAFREKRFTEPQLMQMLAAWMGKSSLFGWSSLERSLKGQPELRGKIAYVYGKRFLVLRDPTVAARLFRLSLSDLPADSPLRKYAQVEVDKLSKK